MPIRRTRRTLAPLCALFLLVACGGEGVTPPPPPAPPPPAPPPPPPPALELSLGLGEERTLSDPDEMAALRVIGASEDREYVLVVHNTSRVASAIASARLIFRGVSTAAGTIVPGEASVGGIRPPVGMEGRIPASHYRRELELRAQVERDLRARGAAYARPPAAGGTGEPAALLARATDPPAVGDTVDLASPVVGDQGLDCRAGGRLKAVARAVGERFVILEDTAVAGHFTEDDFSDLSFELDDVVYPVDSAYFGQPADLDGNERVFALFTKEVNRLNPQEDENEGIIIGFFTFIDVLDPAGPDGVEGNEDDCPASNQAEILWLLAPDPEGEFGVPIEVEIIKSVSRSLVAHELQHLINAERRFVLGSGTRAEEIWLNEGLSHVAEEVVGLARMGLGTRANLTFGDVTETPEARETFADFHLGNYLNLRRYLRNPSTSPVLSPNNPSEGSFAMRGFAWYLLRWLGDHFGSEGEGGILPGSREEVLFETLAVGGPGELAGIANVEAAAGVEWEELLSRFVAAPAVDDAAPPEAPETTQILGWHFRGVFEELSTSPFGSLFPEGYPFAPTVIPVSANTNQTTNVEIRAGGSRTFRLSGTGSPPDLSVQLLNLAGDPLPPGTTMRMSIVRTR